LERYRHPVDGQRRKFEIGLDPIGNFLTKRHRVAGRLVRIVLEGERAGVGAVAEGQLAGVANTVERRGRTGRCARDQQNRCGGDCRSRRGDGGDEAPAPGLRCCLWHALAPLQSANAGAVLARSLAGSVPAAKRGAMKPQITKLTPITSMPPITADSPE